jgi:LuxR family transcriptional regulator, maltose regulon positive regulatory protein
VLYTATVNRDGGRPPSNSTLRILPTKLFVPRRRQTTVARADLVARIEGGTWRPLTLVVAPAGFGKTTLVTQWIDQATMPVAWLSLEQADADPLRFLSYLLAAVGRIRPQVAQLGGVAPASGDVSLDALLAELLVIPLAEEASPFALVLDDFHEIGDSPTIVDAVNHLLDNLPRCMHLVVTSRVEPALSLAVRRAQDAVTEIQIADLAFSRRDALTFFHDAMGLELDDQAMGTLHQRTEGWVAGMQLAGLSLKRGASADEVLRGLTSDSDVAEFLGKEILDVVDEDQRSFLLDTSVLGRLCGPLCAAVTERPSAGDTLRTAVREGMFLVPLDHRRTWYRYHQLFRDILLRQLRAEAPDREPMLHRRAAGWWMGQDDPHAAASHATLAGAHDLLGEIIERWGMPLLQHSDRHSVERWLAALPDAAFDRYPVAGALAGWLAVLPVRAPPRAGAARAAVARARAALAAADVPAERRADLEGHLVAIEALATRPVADLAGCIAHAEAALAALGEDANAARTVLALQIGVLSIMLGKPRGALEPLERAEAWGTASGNVFAGIAAMSYRAWARRWLGDLSGAEETCRAALTLAERMAVARMGLAGHVHVEQARIHFDRWELASALSSLEEALPRVRLLSDPFLLVTALTLQARVLSAAGELELADASSREASELAGRTTHPLLQAWARSCRWRLALDRNTDTDIDPPMPSPETYEPVLHDAAHCAVLHAIARGHGQQSLDVGRQLLAHSLQAECVSQAIDWTIACAAAFAATGRPAEATAMLAEAIERSRAQRLVRPFVEASAWIATVAGNLSDPDRRFLESLPATAPARPSTRPTAPAQPRRADLAPLAEPLSPRELEVLGLVRQGKSNAEIARALFVSTGTIKTHMHRLMTKIGARNRVEAIRLAEDHGLLSDPRSS